MKIRLGFKEQEKMKYCDGLKGHGDWCPACKQVADNRAATPTTSEREALAAKWERKADELEQDCPSSERAHFATQAVCEELRECARNLRALVQHREATREEIITERDEAEEWADKLANAVARFFHVEIGEHSNLNCPWQNAISILMRHAPATREVGQAQDSGREKDELLSVVQAAYIKHHCGLDKIGWEALSDLMQNALCNAMGDEAFCAWLDKEKEQP